MLPRWGRDFPASSHTNNRKDFTMTEDKIERKASIKRDIEEGMTTVNTARQVIFIGVVILVGALLLGISLGGWFF